MPGGGGGANLCSIPVCLRDGVHVGGRDAKSRSLCLSTIVDFLAMKVKQVNDRLIEIETYCVPIDLSLMEKDRRFTSFEHSAGEHFHLEEICLSVGAVSKQVSAQAPMNNGGKTLRRRVLPHLCKER